MLTTHRPLEEKLTLFWHGHFATSQRKVLDYRMMLRQNEMFREHAAGNFQDLLFGLLKDPAMLIYLDNSENIKAHPNENFGREVLELCTMGVGNYTEKDVREAARAFTGWTNNVLEFVFDADQHDFGEKTFLGRTGNLDGEDVLNVVLEQKVTAEFIAAKLYRYFVRQDIAEPVKTQLGATFRENDYQLRPLLNQIFLSKDFYSPASCATQIKSPVHLVISTYKKMGLREVPTIPDFGVLTSTLGQALFAPPNVAGWAGGHAWITSATVVERGSRFREVLFPDVEKFRPPDRQIPGIYARVGERLKKGMDFAPATHEGDSEADIEADRDEEYNDRYGEYMGYVMAQQRVKPIPRHAAPINFVDIAKEAGAIDPEKIVDHLAARFLSAPLSGTDRATLTKFLRERLGGDTAPMSVKSEPALRELVYLFLNTLEYQLG